MENQIVEIKHRDLKITDERSYYKPFKYPWAFDIWLKHEQSHWIHSQVPMAEDIKDWKNILTDQEKLFLTHIFRFFTQGDIDVAGGYVKNYLPFYPQPEIRMMLMGFANREAVHIAAYSHLIESVGLPETTYNEFLQYSEMKEKHEYVLGLSNENVTLADRAKHIAVFSAFTEGMQLFSSFIMLLNFPRHGKMKDMGIIITYSIVEESMHCEGLIRMFRIFINDYPELWNDKLKSDLYKIAETMVALEDKFIDLAFATGGIIGLSAEEVKKYIRFIADRRLISLGLKGIFKVKKNPLPWVEEIINTPIHGNFFETHVSDYGKGALVGSWSEVFPQ